MNRSLLSAAAAAALIVGCTASEATVPTSATDGPSAPVSDPQPATPVVPAGGEASTPDSPATWGESRCAPPSGKTAGLKIGDQLAELTLKDCDGNDYALTKTCGASATWLFVAHGWCPHCKVVSKDSASIVAGYAGKNVAAINILIENGQSKPPTAADCKAWRDSNKLANVIALYDPKGVSQGLFEEGTTSLNVFISEDRIIRSKAHTDVTGDITEGIDGALK